jgi:hypothetical protein
MNYSVKLKTPLRVGYILDEIGNFRVEMRAGLFDPEAFHTGNYK